MKLDYRILWIDDRINEHRQDGHLKRIEDFLASLGFVPQIVECEDKEQLVEIIKTQRFDLILTDYNLDEEGNNGDVIIQEIRDGRIFTEILFYSAVEDFWEKARNVLDIDRLSYYQVSQGYNGLLDKTEWLINQTVSKLQELTAMRGLMMAETSGLDSLLGELLVNFINRPEIIEKRAEIFNKSMEKNLKFFDDNAKKFEKYIQKEQFENFVNKLNVFGKLYVLGLILQDSTIESFSSEILNNYNIEISEVRNKLAHLKHTIIDGKHHLSFRASDGTTWEFNDERCVEIRQNLKKHTDNLKALATYLEMEVE